MGSDNLSFLPTLIELFELGRQQLAHSRLVPGGLIVFTGYLKYSETLVHLYCHKVDNGIGQSELFADFD